MIHEYIKHLLYDTKNPVILEVGCRVCEDTMVIAENIPNASIFAFEPLPSNFVKAQNNIKDFYNIRLFDLALAEKSGTAEFWVSSDASGFNGSSSLKEPKDHLKCFTHVTFPEKIVVRTTTLDEIFGLINIRDSDVVRPIDFIWADVQGAELDLIKGGQKALENTRYFYCEYYNNEMYAGQVTWTEWARSLPGTWLLIHDFGNDVLLKNMAFE